MKTPCSRVRVRLGLASLFLFLFSLVMGASSYGQGTQAWSKSAPFAFASGALGAGAGLDNAGNIAVVTGASGVLNTTKFSPSGEVVWQDSYPADRILEPRIAGLSSGEVRVISLLNTNGTSLSYALLILNYDKSGTRLWERLHVLTNTTGLPNLRLALDASGNAFVAGSVETTAGHGFFVLKYNAAGELAWETNYNTQYSPNIAGIVSDGLGGLVLAGQAVRDDLTGFDSITLKYDPVGSMQWIVRTNWGVADNDVRDLALDAGGNVFVAGRTDARMSVVKYSPDGNPIWRRGRSAAWFGTATRIGVDENGNAIVYGTEFKTVCFDKEGDDCTTYASDVVYKLDTSGEQVWLNRGFSYADGFSIMPGGEVFVSAIAPGESKIAVHLQKYSSDGTRVWETTYAANSLGSIAADHQGNIFVQDTTLLANAVFSNVRKFTLPVPPAIPSVIVQPALLVTNSGADVKFEARISGGEPFRFEWRFFDEKTSGDILVGTNGTLVRTNLQPAQEGYYSLHVINSEGDATSPEARLKVKIAASIESAPQTIETRFGRQITLNAGTVLGSDLAFQWWHDGTPVPGGTNQLLALSLAAVSDAGSYELVVSNLYTSARSAPILVQLVLPGPLDKWNWVHPLPQGNDINAGAFGNGRYLLVGTHGLTMTSTNGVDWEVRQEERFGGFDDVVFAEGMFVAVSGKGVFTSTNGVDWTTRSSTGGNFLAAGNGIFLVESGARFQRSTNGIDWTDEPHSANSFGTVGLAFGAGLFGRVQANRWEVELSTNGLDWISVPLPSSQPELPVTEMNIFFGNERFVVSRHGQSVVSADGHDWIEGPYNPAVTFLDFAADGQRFVAVGESGPGSDKARTRIFNSEDGLNWRTNAVALSNNLYTVFFGKDQFIAAGDDGNLLVSRDGEQWTGVTQVSDDDFRSLAGGNSRFIATGTSGLLYRSSDGEHWERGDQDPTNIFQKVVFGNGVFVGMKNSGIHVSADAEHWIQTQNGTGSNLIFVNGRFFLLRSDGTMLSSIDGKDWETLSIRPGAPIFGLAWDGSRYAALTFENGTNYILSSSNRVNWMVTTNFQGFTYQLLSGGDGHFVALGFQNVARSANGTDWSTSFVEGFFPADVIYAAGLFIASESNGGIRSSADGMTWFQHFSASQNTLRSLIFHEGAIWAAGNNEAILRSANLLPFLSARTLGDAGAFSLRLRLEPDRHARIEFSEDFSAWFKLQDVQGSNAAVEITDSPPVTLPRRFYRSILLPE